MAYTEQQIYNDILAHVGNDTKRVWYVGIASDVRQRLFTDHSVSEANGSWIYRQATSSDHARNVEAALFKLGFDGGPGGGDNTTDYVYAYRKVAGVTNP